MAMEQEEVIYSAQKSAHTIDNDSWQKVGLMLVTSFNCVYILGFSNLIMVPIGMVWGITGMLLIGAFSLYSNLLLAKLYIIDGQRFIRYRDLVGHVFGKKVYYLTWALQFGHFILCNMGFLLLSGRALKDIFLQQHTRWAALKLPDCIAVSGFIYFIFAFSVPNLSAMGIWSGISVFFTFIYVSISMVISIKDGTSRSRDYSIPGNKEEKVFNALGAVAAIAFANNSGMLPEIQATLKHPAIKNMRKALYVQFTFGLAIYYGLTIIGYWAYGSSISEYMLGDLSGPQWVKMLANISVFLQTVISQHIFCVPVHEALDTRFCRLGEHGNSPRNLFTRFILRVLFFSFSTLFAAMLPFLGDVVTLVGALSLVPLTFLLPTLVFLKVKWCKTSTWEKTWHIFTVILFGLVTVGSTASAIRLIIINAKTYHLFANMINF